MQRVAGIHDVAGSPCASFALLGGLWGTSLGSFWALSELPWAPFAYLWGSIWVPLGLFLCAFLFVGWCVCLCFVCGGNFEFGSDDDEEEEEEEADDGRCVLPFPCAAY